jgi:hypothetical protein
MTYVRSFECDPGRRSTRGLVQQQFVTQSDADPDRRYYRYDYNRIVYEDNHRLFAEPRDCRRRIDRHVDERG